MSKKTKMDKFFDEAQKEFEKMFPGNSTKVFGETYVDGMLERGAKLLHGEQWKNGVAKDLNVSPYWIDRWHKGESPIPIDYVQDCLESAMQKRIADFTKFGRDIISLRKYNENVDRSLDK